MSRKVVTLKEASNVLFGVEMEFASPKYSGGSSRTEAEADDALEAAIDDWDTANRVQEYGRDGGGVEVDLKPFTFSEYSVKGKAMFGFLDIVKKHKFTGENNHSGMHIHVDRNIFSVTSFQRFLKFLLEYKEQLHLLSRRKTRTSYTNILTTTGKDGEGLHWNEKENWESIFEDPNEYTGNNCLVLNCHGKHGTIECRFFNSTLDVNTALANVQFVRGLCYFIKSSRPTKSWTEFCKYLKDYRQSYKELLDLMTTTKVL